MASTRLYTNLPEDCKLFFYKDPVTNKGGKGRVGYINRTKDDQSRAKYQLASKDDVRLRSPYGISEPLDEQKKDTERKSLDLTIESDALLKALQALDDHNVNLAYENREKWFGNADLEKAQIKFMYRPLVTRDKTKQGYKPTVRTKVNLNMKTPNGTRFFVIEEKEGKIKYLPKDHTIITKGCRVVPIVEVASLWFQDKSFGMTLESTELLVFPNGTREEFPFQWGEAQTEPMEEGKSEPNENQSGGFDPNTGGPMNDGYNPPSSPSKQ